MSRGALAVIAAETNGMMLDERGDALLRLRSHDQARRSLQRTALRYAARELRTMGFLNAAVALEEQADRRETGP